MGISLSFLNQLTQYSKI